jgi:site-specific DNA-methyltransferase (adenine-specific)
MEKEIMTKDKQNNIEKEGTMKKIKLNTGNSLSVLKTLADSTIDSIVTDPPYELGFMNKAWDKSGIAFNKEIWTECLRVLKPGGHLIAFSGSRTYHRMAVAIEDAGFEIRDQILWMYGSGFPKSTDISKQIDKKAGAEREVIGRYKRPDGSNPRNNVKAKAMFGNADGNDSFITKPSTNSAKQWQGWGTALKPAHEPMVLARKPFKGTVAENVLSFGVGAMNIDESRVATNDNLNGGGYSKNFKGSSFLAYGGKKEFLQPEGRWPANVIHDGLNEEWARYFYCAKASKKDRGEGNGHPTVKPTDLMAYLVRLVTPPGGIVLDPFNGSGSTGKACARLGFNYIGIDLSQEYIDISKARIEHELNQSKQEAEIEIEVHLEKEIDNDKPE